MTLYRNENKSYYERMRNKALGIKEDNSDIQYDENSNNNYLNRQKLLSSGYEKYNNIDVNRKIKKQKKKFNIVNRIIQELSITLILFAAVLCCKNFNNDKTTAALNYARSYIDVDYEKPVVEKLKSLGVEDWVNNAINKVQDTFKNNEFIEDNSTINTTDNNQYNSLKADILLPSNGAVIEDKDGIVSGKGVLLDTKEGSDIFSPINGTVRRIMNDNDTLNTIVIGNTDGLEVTCSGIGDTFFKEGDEVEKGETIGKSSLVGKSKTPAIIFKISYKGEEEDPRELIK